MIVPSLLAASFKLVPTTGPSNGTQFADGFITKYLLTCNICKLLEQVGNKLLMNCTKFDVAIRLVASLFQQDWCSHDITIL